MSVDRATLLAYLDNYLKTSQFRDYAPNGLQVEGRQEIKKIVSGVTACQALLDKAVSLKADAVLVHHGYFWKGEAPALVGAKYRRIRTLIQNDINLLGYHLPLDAHEQVGNNAQLAERLDIDLTGPLVPEDRGNVAVRGRLREPLSAQVFADKVADALGRKPTLVQAGEHLIETIAVCTGGAQGYIQGAIDAGVDAYISGEISEHTTHSAREGGVHYIAAGHHATERYGVQALGAHLAEVFDIEHLFIDIDNPA